MATFVPLKSPPARVISRSSETGRSPSPSRTSSMLRTSTALTCRSTRTRSVPPGCGTCWTVNSGSPCTPSVTALTPEKPPEGPSNRSSICAPWSPGTSRTRGAGAAGTGTAPAGADVCDEPVTGISSMCEACAPAGMICMSPMRP
ncbi:hypothetical protein ACQEV4_18135 [Streptomyces shenzhenensis]|uniref:hypothetical protein n=1 Tax=Streptomyces shenzhenensis TaxID=943815 RepID=UPI003D9280AF